MEQLSTGVIARIMAGEKVEKPVLQILGYHSIYGRSGPLLRLLASDGKYMSALVMLAPQHTPLFFLGEMAEFSIIVVDKYTTHVTEKTFQGKRTISILELTVLTPGPEVGRKIGDPVEYTEWDKKTDLSRGVLARIMRGADIQQPVLQVLSLKGTFLTVDGMDEPSFTATISDGVNYTKCYVYPPEIKRLIREGQYCIIRLDEYKVPRCEKGSQTRKWLAMLKWQVLVGGHEIGRIIGNPVLVTEFAAPLPKVKPSPKSQPLLPVLYPGWSEVSIPSTQLPAPKCLSTVKDSDGVTYTTNTDAKEPIAYFSSRGVLNRMLNHEEVKKPVLQVLRIKKLTTHGLSILCPMVSDAKHIYNNCVFNIKLNRMYDEGHLSKYCVIGVDKFSIVLLKKANPPLLALNITDLTVLCCGSKVGYTLGHPVMLPAPPLNTSHCNDISILEPPTFFPTGAIPKLFFGKLNGSIILQILSRGPVEMGGNSRLALVVSDGKYKSKHIFVSHRLHRLFDQLKPKSIIEVHKFHRNKSCQCLSGSALTITELTVIAPANHINYVLGRPREYTRKTSTKRPGGKSSPEKDRLVALSTISSIEPKTIDTIGICTQIGPIVTKGRHGKISKMRDLTLIDSYNNSVRFTLCGDYAINFSGAVKSILLVKGAVLIEFNGIKSLTTNDFTEILINPDNPECRRLRQWLDKRKKRFQ